MDKKIKLAMAGWGTWWHVFPIRSLINYIQENSQYSSNISDIFWFGKKNSLEEEIYNKLEKRQNVYFVSIFSWKYRRESSLVSLFKNIRDIFLFSIGVFQALYFLQKNKIDVVFCKGGYVALPVVIAGKILRKKIFVHESDTKPGLVNRISSKFSSKNFIAFPGVLPNAELVWQILSKDIIITDQDLVSDIKNIGSSETLSLSQTLFYSNPEKTKLLVVGWSQGSKSLYTALYEILSQGKLLQENYEIYLVLWKENQWIRSLFQYFSNVQIFDFVSQKEMWKLLYYCDLALTRAWTTSLAEQKLYNMKLVMVPIPWTHDQYENAKYYVQNYWDILVDSKQETFISDLRKVLLEQCKYKKDNLNCDLLKMIEKPKQIIVDYIIK